MQSFISKMFILFTLIYSLTNTVNLNLNYISSTNILNTSTTTVESDLKNNNNNQLDQLSKFSKAYYNFLYLK